MSERVIKLKYVWLDGGDQPHPRTKTRYIKQEVSDRNLEITDIPDWGFDGSSTGQADVTSSDMILKPIKLYTSSENVNNAYVMCEVYNIKDKPHISNSRSDLRKIFESDKNADEITFGIEQEYVMINPKNQQPYKWPEKYDEELKEMKTMFPGPQGRYYCGSGNFIRGRDVVEEHARRCLDLGLKLTGTNAEVMLSQWEYQLGPQNALDLADDLWMARFLHDELADESDFAIETWPKLFKENDQWAGTGCHINFSTPTLRNGSDNAKYIDSLLVDISEDHKKHIKVYGPGNELRLTGKNETCHIDSFEWGNSDRSVAMRIPHNANYIEDRRPGGNIDPYEALSALLESILRADAAVAPKKSKKKEVATA